MRLRSLGILGSFLMVVASVRTQVSATLVANTPMNASWAMGSTGGASSFPAGALAVDGSISVVAPAGNAALEWFVPAPGSAACRLRASRATPTLSTVFATSADLTMSIVGPAGFRGDVRIVMDVWDDLPWAGSVEIDIGDDGSFEATSQTAQWLYRREWRLPAVVGANGLDVRILHSESDAGPGPGASWDVIVSFEPWSEAVTDLGSSCAINDVGWDGGLPSDNHPYWLHGAPAIGGDLCRLVARGHGPVAAFVIATDATRVAAGWLGLGLGCDDLLQNSIATIPGQAIATDTWEFVVPALPPGLTFYVQHASFGPGGWPAPFWRTGVTNLVRVDS